MLLKAHFSERSTCPNRDTIIPSTNYLSCSRITFVLTLLFILFLVVYKRARKTDHVHNLFCGVITSFQHYT